MSTNQDEMTNDFIEEMRQRINKMIRTLPRLDATSRREHIKYIVNAVQDQAELEMYREMLLRRKQRKENIE